MEAQDSGDASRVRSNVDPACVWVTRSNERKSQFFPSISSDVSASVMEMQIKLSVRAMTNEITDAA